LESQIATVQRQVRELEATTAGPSSARSAPPVTKMTELVKEMLAPPARPVRARRDLFDTPNEPLKELEAEPAVLSQKPEPDLFSPRRIDCSTKPEDKLVHYLSAGSIKSYRPLKHVQRQTRNRFFMWLGLSVVALWFIYAVLR
jgi:hypothetical protein